MELKISGIGAIIAESKGSLAKYKENKTYEKQLIMKFWKSMRVQ